MTLAERVLALADQGMTFPLIAAILDITPAQVEEAFEGGEVAIGVPLIPSLCFNLGATIEGGSPAVWPLHGETTVPTYPAGAAGTKPDTPNATITLGPVLLGEGGHFDHRLQMHSSLIASLVAQAVSADGTQTLTVSTFELFGSEYHEEHPVENSGGHTPWGEAFGVTGTQLSLDEKGRITTSTGGLYFCTTIAYIEPGR